MFYFLTYDLFKLKFNDFISMANVNRLIRINYVGVFGSFVMP